MKLKDFKLLIVFFLFIVNALTAQYTFKGKVLNAQGETVPQAEVYIQSAGLQQITDEDGNFLFEDINEKSFIITIFSLNYEILEKTISLPQDDVYVFTLNALGEELSEVVITQRKKKIFGLKQLKPVEGTAIYAGKKSEVVLLENAIGNIATNNARQIYSQVVGLNIYENSVGGLQLNIGGRGLDPNRTANFNTRQNGYDISADVLGYPESYYTPPAEALSEIQVVRGAASLQYGTQFGGLINFKMKSPNPNKKIELVSRQTLGSNHLFTSFNSLSGTLGKFSYYTYFNYKTGEGYRPRSAFDSKNFFGSFKYEFSEDTRLTFEATYLDYLAEQPGGLTDTQFREDPFQSNRARNWFQVNWALFALKFEHSFSEKTDLSINLFALDASREALGFRGIPGNLALNPISVDDEQDAEGNFINPRDLIIGEFNNWGTEVRLLNKYNLFEKEHIFLIGTKFYKAENAERQGPGSLGTDADFTFRNDQFPDYPNQSDYDFPNLNVAVFGENIFNITDRFSLTPGFRFEYIKTEALGTFQDVTFDNAGNVLDSTFEDENRDFERSFVLLGLGSSYKWDGLEAYANVSQNYRSVTFSNIRVTDGTFTVRPDITDEEGYTADLGIRGKLRKDLSYDVSVFGLWYQDRIAEVINDRAERERGNVGDAVIYGLETFLDWNIANTLFPDSDHYVFSSFLNLALTDSEYTNSELTNVSGKKVEFVPNINLKSGLSFGYKNFLSSLQVTHIGEQFTDAQNNTPFPENAPGEGIRGEIPAYTVLDLSASYTYKNWRLETGINNLLDNVYFTQRATGYPGPGIITAEPRVWYATLQFTW